MAKLSKRDEEKYLQGFGANIRSLRIKRGWTLEETEDHGWTSWRHLQKIESGKNITLKTVFKLADLFDVAPKDLMSF